MTHLLECVGLLLCAGIIVVILVTAEREDRREYWEGC